MFPIKRSEKSATVPNGRSKITLRIPTRCLTMDEPKLILRKYIPEPTVDKVHNLIVSNKIYLRISRKRMSKFGDYRPPVYNGQHKISVNHDLNPFAFLITLIHEIAHLQVWNKYANKVKPHGKEWQLQFRELMQQFLGRGIFPADLEQALNDYLIRAKASSTSDRDLTKILMQYDAAEQPGVFIENLPAETKFTFHNGRRFIKKDKLRKRYKCLCIDNGRMYLFSPVARVEPITD